MIKIARYLYQKFTTTRRLQTLKIEEAGIDGDGDAFVRLKDDYVFYGPKPVAKEKKFYSLFLSGGTKNQLPFDCYQVAIDIVIRYKEGNLKWGGPAKEAYYKVKEGDVIAEMGAFRGYYTLYLTKQVGTEGRIVAIEPIPDNVRYLKKNISENHLKNVSIVPKGVWNKDEEKVFQRKSTDFQSGSIDMSYDDSDAQKIEVNTLDTILKDQHIQQVDFMLIQLNGAEYEALEGLTSLAPKNLSIAARYDKEGRDIAKEIQLLLEERGYEVQSLNQKFVYGQLN